MALPLLLLGALLGVLARLHRSPLLAGATVLFLLSTAGGSGEDPSRWVVPAAVVLAGAIAALVLRAHSGGARWTMEW